jgi:hypothetical protein
MKILESASKLVFILMTIALIVLTFFGKIDAKDFMGICLMVFTYYFSNKGSENNNFLGK